jgi:hypothetical protein
LLNFPKRFLAILLAIMAMLMLAGCSSTDEAAQPEYTGGTGGGEDCSRITNQVDISECKARNQMRGY